MATLALSRDVPRRKIPMAIWIGTKDQLVPLQVVRDTRDVLRERGFPIALTEIKATRTRTPSGATRSTHHAAQDHGAVPQVFLAMFRIT
jgi:hypothetical protein